VSHRVSHARLGVDQEQEDGLVDEAIKRIDLCLARRTSGESVVVVSADRQRHTRGLGNDEARKV
jgi:hypothetical protein